MPYNVKRGTAGCPGYAVVGDDGKLKGCHKTRSEATAHQRALYANVKDVKKYDVDSSITKCCPESELEKAQGPCWEGYEQIGWKNKNGKRVPNCVPKNQTKKSADDRFEIVDSHPKCEGVALVEKDGTTVLCYATREDAERSLAEMRLEEPEASMRPDNDDMSKSFWRGIFR